MRPSRDSRMKFFSLRSAAICSCLALLASSASGVPIVNLSTGLSLEMQESTSGTLTMQFTNVGDGTQSVNSYSLAILVVQTSGTSTLTFDSWTKPADPVLIGDVAAEYTPFDQPALFPLNAPVSIGGTEYFEYYAVQAAATDNFDYPLLASATKNVGLMTFTNSGEGSWDLYVINQEAQAGGLPLSLMQNLAGDEFAFGNLPVANGAALKMGTVVAVPEPSTVVLAGVAVLAGLLPMVRRRICGRPRHRSAA